MCAHGRSSSPLRVAGELGASPRSSGARRGPQLLRGSQGALGSSASADVWGQPLAG